MVSTRVEKANGGYIMSETPILTNQQIRDMQRLYNITRAALQKVSTELAETKQDKALAHAQIELLQEDMRQLNGTVKGAEEPNKEKAVSVVPNRAERRKNQKEANKT